MCWLRTSENLVRVEMGAPIYASETFKDDVRPCKSVNAVRFRAGAPNNGQLRAG